MKMFKTIAPSMELMRSFCCDAKCQVPQAEFWSHQFKLATCTHTVHLYMYMYSARAAREFGQKDRIRSGHLASRKPVPLETFTRSKWW